MIDLRFPWRRIRLASALLLTLGVLAAAGFASKSAKVNVSGKVTYKGEAVGWGNAAVSSSPDGTLYSSARLNPDGTFTATDVPQGEVQVALQSLPIPAAAMRKKGGPDAADDEGLSFPSKFIPIPPKYQDPKTSGLHFTIGSGDNSLNIQLQQTNEQKL